MDILKKRPEIRSIFWLCHELIIPWLGIVNLFQTFDDLESVKDKEADTQAVRQMLDDETENGAEVRSC
jgi:hypothetical protein